MDERYIVSYLDDDPPDFEAVVDRCLELGLTTTDDGRTDVTRDYKIGDEWVRDGDPANVGAVAERIAHEGDGHLDFWYGELSSTSLNVSLADDDDPAWRDHRLSLSFRTMPLDPNVDLDPEQYSRQQVQRRVERVVEVVGALAAVTEPEYAYGMLLVGPEPAAGLNPTGRPISEHVEKFPWVFVLSPRVVGDLGGYERVLATPAWRVEQLETGHVLVVRSDNLVDPTQTPPVSINEYLLEGRSLDELRADQSGADDPFLELAPGDLGTDLVVDRREFDGDLTDDDLELVRCEVREDGLWDVESGRFVRRIFDDRGNLVGDLPEGVAPEDEPYPPLIRLDVPATFVRLDDPDGENVVTMAMALDAEVDKVDLLANLASAVDGEDDDEGLAVVEDILEQLVELDDVEGVTRLVKERLM